MRASELATNTIDPDGVARFSIDVDWWDPCGVAGWLHRYNEVRVPYIRDAACRKYRKDPTCPDCLKGLHILDVGCGAGVLCEALAMLGAYVVGIDPAQKAVDLAKEHARQSGVDVDYRCLPVERLVEAGEQSDIVLSMEVLEHLVNWECFLEHCAKLTRPGGLIILSTLNRTYRSFLYAILMGEYVLRFLPRGTHQWSRFVTPQEIRAVLESCGMAVTDGSGVSLNLRTGRLERSEDLGVNFLLTAERPA